ncbi:hypothetical protein FHS42_006266 [Streptomyces zagrosensis]|uniref:Uncharacterized protein n=1 Tax=Streptomyces zagrosensis TaxID=1042984 RepID=A0A7W9QFQ2_9ACTN|nr:hypothetical protein [Streptomyces zagrosensis]
MVPLGTVCRRGARLSRREAVRGSGAVAGAGCRVGEPVSLKVVVALHLRSVMVWGAAHRMLFASWVRTGDSHEWSH